MELDSSIRFFGKSTSSSPCGYFVSIYWFGRNFQMERLTAEVQSVFRELVMQGDWLSSETKGLAESKIQNIVHRFGHSLIFILDFFKYSLVPNITHVQRHRPYFC